MVHGILQFTPSIAFRYVLHRCESRDIRCRESLLIMKEGYPSRTRTVSGATGASSLVKISLAQFAPGFVNAQRRGSRTQKRTTDARRSTGGGTRARSPQAPDVMTGSRVVLLGRFRQ